MYQYEALSKNLGNLTIKEFVTGSPSFYHLLRSSPLGHIYSDPSVFPMNSCIPGSSQMCVCVDNLLRFCVYAYMRRYNVEVSCWWCNQL